MVDCYDDMVVCYLDVVGGIDVDLVMYWVVL